MDGTGEWVWVGGCEGMSVHGELGEWGREWRISCYGYCI